MPDPRRFHEPCLSRNREIVEELRAGDTAAAERPLAGYLGDCEPQLTDAYPRWIAESAAGVGAPRR